MASVLVAETTPAATLAIWRSCPTAPTETHGRSRRAGDRAAVQRIGPDVRRCGHRARAQRHVVRIVGDGAIAEGERAGPRRVRRHCRWRPSLGPLPYSNCREQPHPGRWRCCPRPWRPHPFQSQCSDRRWRPRRCRWRHCRHRSIRPCRPAATALCPMATAPSVAAVAPSPSATELAPTAEAFLPPANEASPAAVPTGPMATASVPSGAESASAELVWKYLVPAPPATATLMADRAEPTLV